MMETTGIGGVDSPMPAQQKKLEQNANTIYNLSQEELAKKFRGGRAKVQSEADKKAKAKYDAKNSVIITVKLNRKTDADIVPVVENCKEKGQLVKAALRLYIEKENEK